MSSETKPQTAETKPQTAETKLRFWKTKHSWKSDHYLVERSCIGAAVLFLWSREEPNRFYGRFNSGLGIFSFKKVYSFNDAEGRCYYNWPIKMLQACNSWIQNSSTSWPIRKDIEMSRYDTTLEPLDHEKQSRQSKLNIANIESVLEGRTIKYHANCTAEKLQKILWKEHNLGTGYCFIEPNCIGAQIVLHNLYDVENNPNGYAVDIKLYDNEMFPRPMYCYYWSTALLSRVEYDFIRHYENAAQEKRMMKKLSKSIASELSISEATEILCDMIYNARHGKKLFKKQVWKLAKPPSNDTCLVYTDCKGVSIVKANLYHDPTCLHGFKVVMRPVLYEGKVCYSWPQSVLERVNKQFLDSEKYDITLRVSYKHKTEETVQEGSCKLCFENSINRVNIPCGHSYACAQCTTKSRTESLICCICRKNSEAIPLYIS